MTERDVILCHLMLKFLSKTTEVYAPILKYTLNNAVNTHFIALLHSLNSFIRAISIALFKSVTTRRRSRHSTDTVLEFHAEAP